MSGIGTGYDLSVSTYSPDGKVFQTEYAQKAVDNSGTAIGVRCKDGVVLAVEKPQLSKLLISDTNRAISTVDDHAGIAVAGMTADGRMIVNHAQDEAQSYRETFGEAIPGHVLCERLASHLHIFNLYGYYRPYGAAALLAIYDRSTPQLYLLEPSGVAHRYFGAAVGKNRQAARTEIEKLKLDELSCEQAVKEVARILYAGHEDEKPLELELSWLCEGSGRQHQAVPKELKEEAVQLAKASLDEGMED